MRKPRVFPLALLLLAPLALAAQEKITLRVTPGANQVIRLGMVQQLAFDMSSSALPGGGMKMEGKITFRGTQKVGAPNATGQLVAQVSFDTVLVDMNLNGSPVPAGAIDSLIGQVTTITYDADGKIVDVKAPGMLATYGGGMKEMLGSLTGNIPNATLAVGDSVTVPSSMALPIPGLPDGTKVEGTNTFHLLAINRDGTDRIAVLDVVTLSEVRGAFEMKLSGTGKVEWNVDKGFVRSGSNEVQMDATISLPGGAGTMRMLGELRMLLTGSSRPAP